MTTTTTKTKRAGKGLSRAVLAGATLSVFSLTSISGAMAAVEPSNTDVQKVEGKGYGVEYLINYLDTNLVGDDNVTFIGSLTVAHEEGQIDDDIYAWCVELFNDHVEGQAPDGTDTITGEAAEQANYIIQKYQDDVDMHPEIAAAMHTLLDPTNDLTHGDFYNWDGTESGHAIINSWGNLKYLVDNGFDFSEWEQWAQHPDGFHANTVKEDVNPAYSPQDGAAEFADVIAGSDELIAEAKANAGNYEVSFDFAEVDSRENTVDVTVDVVGADGESIAADEFTNKDGEGITLDLTTSGSSEDVNVTNTVTPGQTVEITGVTHETDIALQATSNEVFPGATVEEHHYEDAQDKVYFGGTTSIEGSVDIPQAVEPTSPDAPEIDVNVVTQASENTVEYGTPFYDNILVNGFDELDAIMDEQDGENPVQSVESQLWYTGDVDPSAEPMDYEAFQEALESGEIEAELVEEYSTPIDGNVAEDAEMDLDEMPEIAEDAVLDGIYQTEEFTPEEAGYYVYTESVTVDETLVLEDEATAADFDVALQSSSQSEFGVAAETVLVEEAPEDANSQEQKQKQKQKQQQEQNQNQEVIIEIVNNPSFNFSFDKDGNIIDEDTGEIVDEDEVIDEHGPDGDDGDGDGSDDGDDNGDGDGSGDGDQDQNQDGDQSGDQNDNDDDGIMDGGGGATDDDDSDIITTADGSDDNGGGTSDPKANPDADTIQDGGGGAKGADSTQVVAGDAGPGTGGMMGIALAALAAAGLGGTALYRKMQSKAVTNEDLA